MARVVFLLSKKKEQMKEYKEIKNAKFDKKIENTKKEKEDFNEKIDKKIARIKDWFWF